MEGKAAPSSAWPRWLPALTLCQAELSLPNSHRVSFLHGPTVRFSPPLQDSYLLGRSRDCNITKCHSCLQGESPFLIISVLPVHIFPVRCFHSATTEGAVLAGSNLIHIAEGKVVQQAQETCLCFSFLPPAQVSSFLHRMHVAASFAASGSQHQLKALQTTCFNKTST